MKSIVMLKLTLSSTPINGRYILKRSEFPIDEVTDKSIYALIGMSKNRYNIKSLRALQVKPICSNISLSEMGMVLYLVDEDEDAGLEKLVTTFNRKVNNLIGINTNALLAIDAGYTIN